MKIVLLQIKNSYKSVDWNQHRRFLIRISLTTLVSSLVSTCGGYIVLHHKYPEFIFDCMVPSFIYLQIYMVIFMMQFFFASFSLRERFDMLNKQLRFVEFYSKEKLPLGV